MELLRKDMVGELHDPNPASENGDTAMQQKPFRTGKYLRQQKCCAAQK
jgi:hypothetical protein